MSASGRARAAWTCVGLAGLVALAAGCERCLGLPETIEYVTSGTGGVGPTASASAGGATTVTSSATGTATTGSAGATSTASTGGAGGAGGSSSSTAGGAGSGGVPVCDSAMASNATQVTIGCTNTVGNASDPFGGFTGWCTLQRDLDPASSIGATNGQLVIETSCSHWTANGFAPYAYRLLTGDFLVTTRVSVTDGAGSEPQVAYHGGGLLVRVPNPTPGTDETHVLWSLGVGPVAYSATAYKTVMDAEGAMPVSVTGLNPDVAQRLAICRQGADVHFYLYDPATDAAPGMWTEPTGSPFTFGSLPNQVQVGLTGHAYNGDELLHATFEYIQFADPSPGCFQTLQGLAEP